ncbi:hypothetical protein B7P43_G14561 [Cryptotermes secundus]|uniref:PiggyBac transposable element-derived protein 4 C-terminal zinc-ribbon domain-containing protein n=1 Tax=Cryptotermes secundus TaxID=105785 RepID=A0A2J7QRM5_9NEOP|nr:hypothetical protein B7P43_G14561 [Cryptotermes secundus]
MIHAPNPSDQVALTNFAVDMIPDFLHQACILEEATFHVSGVVNKCNCRIWGSHVVQRSQRARAEKRDAKVLEYFYGLRKPLCPHSFDVAFSDAKIYKIGAPALPDSCMPFGMKEEDNLTELVAVTPGPDLLYHILAVSVVASVEDDAIQSNIAGFVCVFTVSSRSNCRHVPTDQLESVVKEICADDDSGDEIMIPELDEFDSDNNTVIDNDPQDSNDEHLANTKKMTEPNKQCGEGEQSRNEVNDETNASDSSAVTPPHATLKRPPVKDPENRLEGGLKVHKMVHVPPSNNKKNGAMRKCRVCAKHKIRKETSIMCASCGVALCKLSCFNVYHTKKNY